MNVKNLLLIAPLVLAVMGIGALFAFSGNDELATQNTSQINSTDSFVTLETYEASPERFDDKRTVYFFHASWCPTCKTLENDIKRNTGSIPEDVVIVKADFDSETELRQQFGVVSQHTLVQIGQDGTLLGKWLAQPSLRTVLADLQSV